MKVTITEAQARAVVALAKTGHCDRDPVNLKHPRQRMAAHNGLAALLAGIMKADIERFERKRKKK